MANHCIDVVCIKCGSTFCLRGCRGNGPDAELVERIQRAGADFLKGQFRYDDLCCGERVYDHALLYRLHDLEDSNARPR